ncbi:RNA polymerase factor sigma-54 [uncultured Variovorax sp.]|uniref:RNA polymerase factor sigma-54 n=1 Tax=uncultured Variovorax sp. TaxID=114708 RepID=UPI0025E74A0A|nr:RNA polymerase factor sigma-54 [uncultured Variovorax sp.]
MNAFTALEARALQATNFSPRLQQAVRLLQMSSLDYVQALREEAQANPFFVIEDPVADAGEASERMTARMPERSRRLSHDESADRLQRIAVPESLRAHLHAQLGALRLAPRDEALARAVVEALDDDGYLRLSFADIAAVFGERGAAVEHELRTALRRVQALDPCGVGARSVQECLRLQLEAIPDDALRALALRIVKDHLDLLAAHDIAALARAVNEPPEAVLAARSVIRKLAPRPGWRHGQTATQSVVPDLTVKKVRGAWRTVLNAGAMPRARIDVESAQRLESARSGACTELRRYLEQARWMVASVAQRGTTILEVGRAIVARQKLFLEHGPLAMKPLGLREIADDVGVHPSTVSRSVRGKYIATPAGVFELHHFFSRGMQHTSGGASAPAALRELIREMIIGEPPSAPLSDAALAARLGVQGFCIARRTVTKYRQALRIEPVELRRARG